MPKTTNMRPRQQTLPDTLKALEAYAAVCLRLRIIATVETIDGRLVSETYNDAAGSHPARLEDHLRRLKKNPFSSELLAKGQAAQAMAAIADIASSTLKRS